ncbi:MAG: efflux transporter periplasmic adaptor subunit [Rhodobacteraceae bacterium]|nr:efflux transporter periplasmic adaptor subunit [Paracoccaceae bacterium]MBT25391.1 efflux transporter periplasmic adaptor subunit [Paracoccaceae bacterium]
MCGMAAVWPVSAQPVMQGNRETVVGVVTLERQQVPFSTTVPGRAVAFEQVDIRPRVGGAISEIVYAAGQRVAVGDVLFRLEDQTYRAEVASAEAEVALAQASISAAQTTVKRYESLVGKGVTDEELAAARVALLQSQADLSAAQAALEIARLDLDRTVIKSPIAGFADVASVSAGALVTENQTDALTTITRIDPIYVDVEESSRRIGEVRNKIDSGQLSPGETLAIRLMLETGQTYAGQGQMVSPGTSVSTTTGTTEFRLQFDNPDRRILPGQFLRVDITLGTTEAVLVPQGATSRSSGGDLTAFVAVDGKAEQRILQAAGSYRNAWIVTDGVTDGEALIVDGLSTLTDGAAVKTVPVTISDEGVVTEIDTAPTTKDEG